MAAGTRIPPGTAPATVKWRRPARCRPDHSRTPAGRRAAAAKSAARRRRRTAADMRSAGTSRPRDTVAAAGREGTHLHPGRGAHMTLAVAAPPVRARVAAHDGCGASPDDARADDVGGGGFCEAGPPG